MQTKKNFFLGNTWNLRKQNSTNNIHCLVNGQNNRFTRDALEQLALSSITHRHFPFKFWLKNHQTQLKTHVKSQSTEYRVPLYYCYDQTSLFLSGLSFIRDLCCCRSQCWLPTCQMSGRERESARNTTVWNVIIHHRHRVAEREILLLHD